VLTNRRAEAPSRSTVSVGVALILSLTTLTPAYAGSVTSSNCVGWWLGSFNCVRQSWEAGDPYIRVVPEPLGEAEKSQITARDHQWLARCHPVIQRDRYGVPRYHYSAPGCEFGVGAD
jgi:hypothetical protein